MAYELILGASWLVQFEYFFSSCPEIRPEWVFCLLTTMISTWMYYSEASTYFFLDFHVALPKRPTPCNTSTNPLPKCWWCWCSLSMAASPSIRAGLGFPRRSHLWLYTTTKITPCCCHFTLFCFLIWQAYHTFFLMYLKIYFIIENLRYIAETTRYSITQERVKLLYSTRIEHPKSYIAWYIAKKQLYTIVYSIYLFCIPAFLPFGTVCSHDSARTWRSWIRRCGSRTAWERNRRSTLCLAVFYSFK